jgi:alpha-tubulin suppressor-like RCC1 family protein
MCTYPATQCRAPSCGTNRMFTAGASCVVGTCPAAPAPTDCGSTADTKYCGTNGCAGVTQLVTGFDFVCALLSEGTLECWGDNANGQLGLGTTDMTNRLVPTVTPITNVTKLFAGPESSFICAIFADSSAKCWGTDAFGQLANGVKDGTAFPSFHSTPAPILKAAATPMTGVKSIAVGNLYGCALDTAANVSCWGFDGYGQLGDDMANFSRYVLYSTPIAASSTTMASIVAGLDTTCGIDSNVFSTSGVHCWGNNSVGESGQANPPPTVADPTAAAGYTLFAGGLAHGLSAAGYAACGVASDGTLQCWGSNANGVLGRGATDTNVHGAATPVCKDAVANCPTTTDQLMGVTVVGLGEDHACAITAGAVKCWGQNTYGQLGDGTNTPRLYAGAGPTLTGVTDLAVGGYFTCVLLSDRTVRCFGHNDSGQLGDNDTTLMDKWNPIEPNF